MNLTSSSVINEKNNGGISDKENSLTSSPPTIPNTSKILPIIRAYTIYPPNSPTAKITSFAFGF